MSKATTLPGLPAEHAWTDETWDSHQGAPLNPPLPHLVQPDVKYHYDPASCPTGWRVGLRPIGDNVWVCPLCGVWAPWASVPRT